MRLIQVAIALLIITFPARSLADRPLTPSEKFDFDCVVAALSTTHKAEEMGQQGASDSAYETALFYEGRLTARDEVTNWVVKVTDEINRHPRDITSDVAVGVACMRREQELLKMPLASE